MLQSDNSRGLQAQTYSDSKINVILLVNEDSGKNVFSKAIFDSGNKCSRA